MECTQLDLKQTQQMFLFMSQKMIESKEMLTQADQAIGDGDHGIGMAKGFEAVEQKMQTESFKSLGDLFKAVGFTLMTSIGGASGAIFGTMYQGAAASLNDQNAFDASSLSRFLIDGLDAVRKRGKAKPGDKTMVDALEPAAQASVDQTDLSIESALRTVAEAARMGMERTKEMTATMGRAKTLGERSLGHPDPGAVSTHLMLSFMFDYVAQLNIEHVA